MAVQQHVLNWLYSVLTSEYRDVNRTYNDVAQALSQYPSLAPRTDVHTFPNGASALLVHLSGTIPVLFRGATYRFPISIWVPHGYPREAPLAYVTPTEQMVVRPGQHVDPQGQVYHPYLVGWSEFWDKSTILDFLAILRDIFAKEPPVIARQASQPPGPATAQSPAPTPPPIPPVPRDISSRPSPSPPTWSVSQGAERPPGLPPKGNFESVPQRSMSGLSQVTHAPPVPPHPPNHAHSSGRGTPGIQDSNPQARRASRYDSAPALPPSADPRGQPQFSTPPQPQHQPPPGMQPPYIQHSYPPHQPQHPAPQPHPAHHVQPQQIYSQQHPPPPHPGAVQQWQQQQQQQRYHAQSAPPPPQPKAPPPPDIMDEPLTLAIPSPSTMAAPPIPPNPEKDALLIQLARVLHEMRQRSRTQDESSLAGLQAQRNAMMNAMATIQSEASGLNQLAALLDSNANTLREALRNADAVIKNSAQHPAPDIDELLVAPTVVANQLYDLVAEERALADAIFMLGRAVERGRITPTVFAKTTRSLSREWFLKKALIRKIGNGLGLAS